MSLILVTTRGTAQRGFTLIELIMVIVIMGVIGGMVSVFMKGPIDAYFDSGRRASMTDVADTAVRRIARDIHRALPNSLRPLASSSCIEFIPTKTGGRYRASTDDGGAGDVLDFSTTDSSFDMFGSNSSLADQAIAAGDLVVIYNLGITGSNAYELSNLSTVVSPGVDAGSLSNESKIHISPFKFPLASGGNRFHIVPSGENAVTYVCTGAGTSAGNGSGTLYRYVRALSATHTCPSTLAGVAGATELARNVSTCNFDYTGSDLQRNAAVRITLGMTQSGETVNLYHEVHVDNTP